MTAFDLSPLFRTTIGFDRLADVLNEMTASFEEGARAVPPYNIEKLGEDRFRITVAVPGLSEEDLEVTVQDNVLTVTGRGPGEEENVEYLHRGIADGSFELRFALADHVEVTGADLANGLLHIQLARELPEAMKPRRIEISTGGALDKIRKAITTSAA